MSEGIVLAGLDHVCRVCGATTTIYVGAVRDTGAVRPPRVDEHRIAEARCDACDQDRVHVRAGAVSDGGETA